MTDTSYLYEYFMEKSKDDNENKSKKHISDNSSIKDSKKNMKEAEKHERILPA